MATFAWTLQGTDGSTNQTVGATDVIRFSGAAFATPVTVNAYQSTTHMENSGGTEQCTSVHIHNVEYVDSSHFKLDGGASTVLDATHPTTAQCTLKLNFSDASSVTTTGAIFYAYDGSTTTNAPTGVTVQGIEQSDTSWTACGGSAAAVTITDDTAATSHDYYLAMSCTPTSVGEKTAYKWRIELTYS